MPSLPDEAPAPADTTRPDPTRLLVEAGGRTLTLPCRSVREFCAVGRHVAVPGAAEWCLGLVQWRGRLLTLLDAGRLFGSAPTRPRYQVVLDLPGVESALAVDDYLDLCTDDTPSDVRLEDAELRALDVLQPGAAGRPR